MSTNVYGLTSSPEWFTSAVSKSTNNSTSNYKPLYQSFSKSVDDDSSVTSFRRSFRKTKMKKKNRSPVQFSDNNELVHELDSCDVEPEQLWYSSQEILEIRKQGKEILAKVNSADGDLDALDSSTGESIRGLEHGLTVRNRREAAMLDQETRILDRSERRKNIVRTILSQQQEQRDAGIDDPKGLQVTSKACTQWALDRALDVASKDFAAAVQVWREDPDCNKLLPSILEKKNSQHRPKPRTPAVKAMSLEERKSTLDNISKTVASALEELDDLDF